MLANRSGTSLPQNATFFAGGKVIEPVYLNRTWNTTTVNQLLGLPGMFSTYNAPQLLRLRGLAITSSSLSILAGVVGIYYIACIDKRRKVFRHHLILFLISCDFIKAVVLLIYPVAILIENRVYGYPAFYNTLGWFTAYSIEGADFAIAIFAIHFAILIFVPSLKWLNRSTGNMEGGLYRVRHYLYPATFLLPMVLATLAFVGFDTFMPVNLNDRVILNNNNFDFAYQARRGGYKAMSAWCYLPPYPIWYRVVLSWGPRYFIIVLISSIYISIYIFVSKESRKIKNQIGSFRHSESVDIHRERDSKGKLLTLQQRFLIYLKFFFRKTGLSKIMQTITSFFFLSLEDYHDDLVGEKRKSRKFSKEETEIKPTVKDTSTKKHVALRTPIKDKSGSKGPFHRSSTNFSKRFGRRASSTSISPCGPSSILLSTNAAPLAGSTRGGVLNSSSDIDPFYHPLNGEESTEAGKYSVQDLKRINNSQTNNKTEVERCNSSFSLASDKFAPNIFKPNRSRTLSPVRSANSLEETLRGLPTNSQIEKNLIDTKNSRENSSAVALDKDHVLGLKQNFQSETYQDFKKRRAQIQKQLRSIFIYPFSYVIIWTFPLIVDAIQYHYEIIHGPIIWLEYIATFMQPLSCFVDVLVFLYRERPWRHSWASITKKDLYNNYSLKGEIGEHTIRGMCNSELGARGWFYRGRWSKLNCWRYKPQRWKRIAWFCYRFVKGLIRNYYDFEDNCNDAAYWEEYYMGKKRDTQATGSSKLRCSEAFKEVLDVDNSRKDSYFSSSTGDVIYENQCYVKVPFKWRIVHFLPMLEGVDLDELDYQLRINQSDRNLDIPGMSLALQNITKPNVQISGESFFKPDYNMTRSTSLSRPEITSVPRAYLGAMRHSSSGVSQATGSPLNSFSTEGNSVQGRPSSYTAGDGGPLAGKSESKSDSASEELDKEGNVGKRMGLMDFLHG
ncbi:LANO_0A04456g1_1 [Lachancea nothofagi CBS 11611]|uniref:LANO_0A04456g1_1 n=1 Tax=Lachancea nothofagi CBS 11611 TaxID=1266666 RepID=A0A1G4IQP2_9SACH|nr:LANO_0A04456g1_1 [Lachancea nothofagi CBS 11611]